MKFTEPKVEFIRVAANQAVYASGCNDDISGTLVYCTPGAEMDLSCPTGTQFGGQTNN